MPSHTGIRVYEPSIQTLQTKIFIWNTQRCRRMDSTQDQIHALCQSKPTVMSFTRTATIIIIFNDKYPNPTMNRKEKLGSQNLVGRCNFFQEGWGGKTIIEREGARNSESRTIWKTLNQKNGGVSKNSTWRNCNTYNECMQAGREMHATGRLADWVAGSLKWIWQSARTEM